MGLTRHQKRKAAIRIIKESRRTHVWWLDHLKGSGKPKDPQGSVGDAEHHEKCIRDYDLVLAFLKEGG